MQPVGPLPLNSPFTAPVPEGAEWASLFDESYRAARHYVDNVLWRKKTKDVPMSPREPSIEIEARLESPLKVLNGTGSPSSGEETETAPSEGFLFSDSGEAYHNIHALRRD